MVSSEVEKSKEVSMPAGAVGGLVAGVSSLN
jgi:hypothetical protein